MAIWSKGGDETNALVHEFTVGDDYLNDRIIAPYDILGSIAHAEMLKAFGLLKPVPAQALVKELRLLHAEYLAGKWTVEAADEDVHSKVEALLTAPPEILVRAGGGGQAGRPDRITRHPALDRLSEQVLTAEIAERLLFCGGPALIEAAGRLAAIRDRALERRA